jgi:hypothetical protein
MPDHVEAAIHPVKGLVAIVDALGAKLFNLHEAREFIAFRDSITGFTDPVFDLKRSVFDLKRMKTFTLNDTIVYAYPVENDSWIEEVESFGAFLRVAVNRSIVKKYPLRGSLAAGEFYIGDDKTILGPAVTDAASWYEAADWIGVHATPHASMFIQSCVDRAPAADLSHVLIDYPVPLKDGKRFTMKAINWPKAFYVRGLRPNGTGSTRGLVLGALTKRRVPKGTESKYDEAMKFFDHVQDKQRLEDRLSAKVKES